MLHGLSAALLSSQRTRLVPSVGAVVGVSAATTRGGEKRGDEGGGLAHRGGRRAHTLAHTLQKSNKKGRVQRDDSAWSGPEGLPQLLANGCHVPRLQQTTHNNTRHHHCPAAPRLLIPSRRTFARVGSEEDGGAIAGMPQEQLPKYWWSGAAGERAAEQQEGRGE